MAAIRMWRAELRWVIQGERAAGGVHGHEDAVEVLFNGMEAECRRCALTLRECDDPVDYYKLLEAIDAAGTVFLAGYVVPVLVPERFVKLKEKETHD
jgi:hypothetical protein